MNQTCARLLNIDPEGAQGRLVHEMIRKTDLLAFVEAALRGPEPIEGDLQLVGAEDRWLHARGSTLFDARRQKIGALVVLHDITRLRRLESIRRDFVANVSHELRTPVTSIKGFVETLLDGALDDPENARRFLNIVGRQANRLTAIIEDLLTLSRLEKGAESQTVALNREPLKAVLHAAVEMCSNKASEKEIRLELDCDEALVAAINAPLLEQAVVNLIDNAINYSERGSRVEIAAAAEENAVVIRVRDDGCGIEAGHLPRLFERFYRVDKARSRELGGTGLGLAIVKHIALAHQGLVHVESEVRRGSVFSLRLPQNSGFRQG